MRVDALINSLPVPIQEPATHWLHNPEVAPESLLSLLKEVVYPNSTSRYRFAATHSKDEVIRLIFEAAFKTNPKQVIQATETPSPLFSKRGYTIQASYFASIVFGNLFSQIILSFATLALSCRLGYVGYQASMHFTMRRIPFIINHTPLPMIQIFNKVMGCKDWVRLHQHRTFIYYWLIQKIVLSAPNIPYVTTAFRACSLQNIKKIIFLSPQTLFSFIFYTTMNTTVFVWNKTKDIGLFFRNILDEAEREEMATIKAIAYEKWTLAACQLASA